MVLNFVPSWCLDNCLPVYYEGSEDHRKSKQYVCVNPQSVAYLTNGFSHRYYLGESTFIFRGIRSDFYFFFNCLMKILLANRITPDGTPRSAASHLGLYCLPMSHKRDARLISVNNVLSDSKDTSSA